MRKWITLLMTLLVGASVSQVEANTGQISLEAGYRRDNINWRSHFPSDSPFLKTSTRFKDIDIFQIGVHGRSTLGCNFYVRANAYWGWVLDGDFEQSVDTYFSGGYEGAFDVGFGRERHNIVDDRYVYGAGAAIGYPFYFCDCSLVLAPVIGYAIDEQNFRVNDEGFGLYETTGGFIPGSGGCCCDHKWTNRWYGPFVGVDFNYRPYEACWNIFAEFEYHWGYFNGKKHINSEFDYFGFDHHKFHSRDADGWVFAAGADYDLSNCWTVGVSVKFQDWEAHRRHRHDDSFSYDAYGFGGFDGHEKHEHKWHSYAINLTLGKEF